MKRTIVFLSCSVLLLSGCAVMPKKNSPTQTGALLEPQAILKFGDIPMPVGFRFMEQESYAFESAGVRAAALKYRGKAPVDTIVAFYKEQMPLYNWDLQNIVEYGERLLNFERETESCIIRLIPSGNTVTIAVSLGPRSQASRRAVKPIR